MSESNAESHWGNLIWIEIDSGCRSVRFGMQDSEAPIAYTEQGNVKPLGTPKSRLEQHNYMAIKEIVIDRKTLSIIKDAILKDFK